MAQAKRLIRLPEVIAKTGASKSTIYKLISKSAFPRPVNIGAMSAWPESEIDTWVAERIAERDRVAI